MQERERTGVLTGWRRVAVPASLFVSFLANDGEELLTMAASAPRTAARLPHWTRRWTQRMQITQSAVNVAIAVMGLLYAAAVIDGIVTRGRGRLYQDVQLVFGLHGFTHIAASLGTRGYTTGVLTAPTVVIPQWLWARRELQRAGVPRSGRCTRAFPLVASWLVAAHALGARLGRSGDDHG